MPSSRDIRAGGAFVEFSLRRRGLERSLQQVARRLQRFGGQVRRIGLRISALGAVLTTPFAFAVRTFQTTGDALDKMARRTGFSVETLSELDFAAQQSGTSLSALERGIRTLQRNVVDLGRGLATPRNAFKALGLEFANLKGLSPEKQFEAVVAAIAKIEDPTERAARAMQVFGTRTGQELLPLLEGGAAGIADLRREARALGLTISGDTAQSAAAFNDALGRIKLQAKVAAINVGAALAPALTKVVTLLTTAGKAAIDFTKKRGRLIAILGAAAVGVLALGATLTALGVTLGLLGFALAGVVAGVAAVVAGLASIAVPAAIAIGAIAAVGAAVFKFTTVFQDTAGFVKRELRVLVKIAQTTVGGIRDALAGDDIRTAAKLLVNGVKLVFFNAAVAVTEKAVQAGTVMLNAAGEVAFGIAAAFTDAWGAVQSGVIRLGSAVGRVFVEMVAVARGAAAAIKFGVRAAVIETRNLLDPTFSSADAQRERLVNLSDLSGDLTAARRAADGQKKIIETIEAFALRSIENERQARLNMIADQLAAQRKLVDAGGALATAGLRVQIAALEREQAKLLERAAEARRGSELVEKVRDFFGFGSGPVFSPTGTPGGALGGAVVAARGVTSSFNIRSIQGNPLENNVKQIGGGVQAIQRVLEKIEARQAQARGDVFRIS